jgi:hypothetical protein
LKRRGSVRRRLLRMSMWRRTMLKSLFKWWILKRRGSVRRLRGNEQVEENDADELVQLVDFEER